MQRGSLNRLLMDSSVELDWEMQVRFALDAAKGMRFLHGLTPERIHRDLKSPNLLVSDHWVVKVSDFGTSRITEMMGQHGATEGNGSKGRSESATSIEVSGLSRTIKGLAAASSSSSSAKDESMYRVMTQGVGTLLWQSPVRILHKIFLTMGLTCVCNNYIVRRLFSRRCMAQRPMCILMALSCRRAIRIFATDPA